MATPNSNSSNAPSPGASTSASEWFQQPPKNRAAHPYELKIIAMQAEGNTRLNYTCVEFFPFVGAHRPLRGDKPVDWDFWEGCVAVTSKQTLLVRRCSDENFWQEVWTLIIPDEELYHVTWSFDPYNFHPLLAVGGELGVIYIIDALTKQRIRTMTGHGGSILSMQFHPSQPHILASASSDKTSRIWNIRGSDAPELKNGELPSQNYPMGDADEGTCAVAILAGEGPGGHQFTVVGLAFHPWRRVIATTGADHAVKIWALPPLPELRRIPPATPEGYRPKVVYFPLFSTNRAHEDLGDQIAWLFDDILISKSRDLMLIWQWLGLKRFFEPDSETPRVMDHAQKTDYEKSHSFSILVRYPIKSRLWYRRFGMHQRYKPDPLDSTFNQPNAVTEILIAIGVDNRTSPQIYLFNPTLARDGLPPDVIEDLRFEPSREREAWFDPPSDAVPGPTEAETSEPSAQQGITKEVRVSITETIGQSSTTTTTTMTSITSTAADLTPTTPAAPSTPSASAPTMDGSLAGSVKKNKGRGVVYDAHGRPIRSAQSTKNITLNPWVLEVPEWRDAVRKSKMVYPPSMVGAAGATVHMTAISPRGAKWIVAVGERESVYVFRMRDG